MRHRDPLAEIDRAVTNAWDTALAYRLAGDDVAADSALAYIDSLLDRRLLHTTDH